MENGEESTENGVTESVTEVAVDPIERLKAALLETAQDKAKFSEEVDRLNGVNALLMEKLNQVKTTFVPRLQEATNENEALKARNKELDDQIMEYQRHLAENNYAHQQQIDTMQQRMMELESINRETTLQMQRVLEQQQSQPVHHQDDTSEQLSNELNALKETYAKSQRDVQRLRQHLLEAEEIATQEQLKQEDALQGLKRQMDVLQNEAVQWKAVADEHWEQLKRFVEDTEEKEDISTKIKQENVVLKNQIMQLNSALSNLQVALQDMQSSKEDQIESMKANMTKALLSVEKERDGFKQRALEAESQLDKIDMSVAEIEQMQKELADRNVLVGQLRHDLIQSQSHLSEAMKRIATDDAVDRKLISNLVVQYITAPQGEKTRYEMLKVIAGILKFTTDEKHRCGLHRDDASRPINGGTENVADAWISFLMAETSENDLPSAVTPSKEVIQMVSVDAPERNGISPLLSPKEPPKQGGGGLFGFFSR